MNLAQLLLDPLGLAVALLRQPWATLLVALGGAGLLAFARAAARARRSASVAAVPDAAERESWPAGAPSIREPRWYSAERVLLGIGALLVIVAVIGEHLVRGYNPQMSDAVSWWRYAVPIFAAAVVLAALSALIIMRGNRRPEQPVVGAERRTWSTFSTRPLLVAGALSTAALLATTIAANTASAPDPLGRFVWLEIPVPNTDVDPVRPWFYGWEYGVPVLICLGLLVTAAVLTLRSNTARPFFRPDTVQTESRARRDIARGSVQVAVGAVLLTLAGAWRFIADAASVTTLVVGGDPTQLDVVWRYASLAAVGGWLAPIVEIVGFAALLLAAGLLPRTLSRRIHEPNRSASPVTA